MKASFRLLLVSISIGLLLSACGEPVPTATPPPPTPTALDPEALAQGLVELLAQGRYQDVVRTFDAGLKDVLPADKLQEAWESVLTQFGSYQGQIGTRLEEREGYDLVEVTTEFSQGSLDVQVLFDQAGLVAGLFFDNPQAVSDPGDYYVPPDYADLDAFEERNLVVGNVPWILPATFTQPAGEGPFPTVLLVPDAGPQDRDETTGFNKPFRDLAWGLASKGIAVLRFEKRSREYPDQVAALQDEFTVYDEVIDDTVDALALMQRMKDVDAERIYVVGHGLGGMLVPRIGELAPDVAGFAIMAGTTRPLEDVYLEQVAYVMELDGELSEEEEATLAEIEAQVARVKEEGLSLDTPPADLPLGLPPAYWLDLRDYDPPAAAQALDQPLLIMQGERDYQVSVGDYQGWQSALSGRADVEFKLYPSLNHLFIEGEGMGTPTEDFTEPGHVAEIVIDDLAAWIEAH